MKNNISQQFIWERMTMSLKYVRKDKQKNMFIPKVIIRKAEKQFNNNPKVIG